MVVPQYEDFVASNASSRHALLAILLVHHMFEWAHGREFSKESFLEEYPNDSKMADLFDLARNISNGTKHFAPRAVTSAGGGFSSAFSDAFQRPLNIETPPNFNRNRISADILLRELVTFWKVRYPRD
ncbi:MAG: hypothetical protein F4Y47_20075 [Acidobacteriia bacterium]|nr:hypothetical protein [Terriglobia bacterium]MYG02555.1 hypothetical protein [Terriglobia bacterium]MYK08034.1 hypothetical protein [Terriglobia bacterium]